MNPNNPAFPFIDRTAEGFCIERNPGLTKREWFAGLALQGMLAGSHDFYDNLANKESIPSDVTYAHIALAFADALIAELSKGGE